jgi:hypothetical protein
MNSPSRFPFKPVGHAGPALESRADELRGRLRLVPPNLLAERTGAAYLSLGPERGEFHLTLLDAPITLAYPDLIAFSAPGDVLPAFKQALLLYYFLQSDGSAQKDQWVSFADLPDGRTYSQAFQGYSGDELSKTFALALGVFRSACVRAGGIAAPLGDAAYRYQALPRVQILVIYHLGDDDFASSCKVLFDASVGHYLPTDACAILGSMLTQKIVRAKSLP